MRGGERAGGGGIKSVAAGNQGRELAWESTVTLPETFLRRGPY